MMTEPTKGPWRCVSLHGDPYALHAIIADQDATSGNIAELPYWGVDLAAEQKANARLIAAAPELLETVTKFCSAYVNRGEAADSLDIWYEGMEAAHAKALAALAKAGGSDD